MSDDGLPGQWDVEGEARVNAEASARGGGPSARQDVLKVMLSAELRAEVEPAAGSGAGERVGYALRLREQPAWRAAPVHDRAVVVWLLASSTTTGDDGSQWDGDLPRGVRDAVVAILGRTDRAGGWVDPPDAPAAAPLPLDVVTDWTRPVPPREWTIGEWIPKGRVGIVAGRAGMGKSRLMVQVATRLAAGPGMPPSRTVIPGAPQSAVIPKRTRTLIVSYEDETEELCRRIQAISTGSYGAGSLPVGARLEDVGDGVAAFHARGVGVMWGPREGQHDRTAGSVTPFGARVLATAEAHHAGLLVLDPAAACYGSDESSRNHVRVFLDYLDQWGSGCGCAVAVVMHPPKRPPGSASTLPAIEDDSAWAGSGDWRGAARWGWSVGLARTGHEREPTGTEKTPKAVLALALASLKQSYGPNPAPIFLTPDGLGWSAITSEAAAHEVAQGCGWNLKAAEGGERGEATQPTGDAILR